MSWWLICFYVVVWGMIIVNFLSNMRLWRRNRQLQDDLGVAHATIDSLTHALNAANGATHRVYAAVQDGPSDRELLETYRSLGAPIPKALLERVAERDKVLDSIMKDLDELEEIEETW